ncbi:MAG: Do family serine endopeptidase [Hyphomicrobiales bacterium]|nr:Do family serine endopeptidase [Hyphomicrobiales bacterium]
MRLSFLTLLVLMIAGSAGAQAQEHPGSFADLVPDLIPAVVHISTTEEVDRRRRRPPMPDFPEGSPFHDFFEEFFERRQFPQRRQPSPRSTGSGFIIDETGFVVTNDHVIEDADLIEVTLADGVKLPAEIIGRDPKTDLALLKIESDEPLPFVELGDEENVRVGDWVIAIGNPFGLGGTVTAGIVSGFNRDINSGPYDNFIQTDASINWGNSGGPLFDLEGRVIGINTKILSPSGGSVGIGFAIPSSVAIGIVDQLRNFGEARRGWLGVRIQEVSDEIAASLGMEAPQGALVSSVEDGSPASDADIHPGDVILRFGDEQVEKMRDLPRLVAKTNAYENVTLDVWRDERTIEVDVRIGRLEEDSATGTGEFDGTGGEIGEDGLILGMKLATLDSALRERFSIDSSTEGVIVEQIASDSEAFQKGVREGSIVAQVGGTRVASLEDVLESIEKARRDSRAAVLFLFIARNTVRFIALNFDRGEQ